MEVTNYLLTGMILQVVIPLIFPKVPQSFVGCVGIRRVPQLPPPLEHPRLRTL